jgi:hypothetical protein
MKSALACAAVACALLGSAGCEKPNDENIDKWMRTKKGPEKLRAAVSDPSISAAYSAHAAANLVRKQLDSDVRAGLEKLTPKRRAEVAIQLIPRLWDMARIEGGELAVPTGEQALAKDMLVDIRPMVDGADRARIDGYLIDWYTSGFYDARATPGRHPGAEVIRVVGPAAGDRLIPIADSILAKSLTGAQRLKLSDELMLAMGASGSPATVKYLLDLATLNRGDKTQGARAISALFRAYVDPRGLFTPPDPAALVPHVQTLVGFAKGGTDGRVTNDAISLVLATGKPTCLAPLLSVTAYPHENFLYRYIGATAALRCGGAAAIGDVVSALPEDAPYVRDQLGGAVWRVIAKLEGREEVLSALRELAKREGKLARWIAIEALAAMHSTQDAALLQAMSTDRRKLVGYWGDQTNVAQKDRKVEPTLGERASALALELAAGKGS